MTNRWTQDQVDEHNARLERQKAGHKPEQEGHAINAESPEMKARAEKKQSVPRRQIESDMQQTLFKALRENQGTFPLFERVFAVPNGGYRSDDPGAPAKRAKLVREGMSAGVLDIFVDVPWEFCELEGDKDYTLYHGLRIEMKRPGGSLSPAQSDWIAYYKANGYRAEVCFSWESAWNLICEYLGYDELMLNLNQKEGGK